MKYILTFLALILVPTTLLAQNNMAYFRDLVQTFEERVFPHLLDQVSNSDRNILRSVDFQLIENPVVVTAVYTESDTKKVYIYAGFLDGLYNYVDCVIITKTSDGRKACDNYFDYYSFFYLNSSILFFIFQLFFSLLMYFLTAFEH